MNNLTITTNPLVNDKFDQYPDKVKGKLLGLRKLIIQAAEELEGISSIEETLKWGEPSYIAKNGSTIRMDWKSRAANQYAMYFSCTTSLVETFRKVYGPIFNYEGNRAIVFELNQDIPELQLMGCIKAALRYHKVKHLPNLGIV